MWNGSLLGQSACWQPRWCRWTWQFPPQPCPQSAPQHGLPDHRICRDWGRIWPERSRGHSPSIQGSGTNQRKDSLALAGIMLGTATCKSCHVNQYRYIYERLEAAMWMIREDCPAPTVQRAKGPMHESSSITNDHRKLTSIKVYLATCIFFTDVIWSTDGGHTNIMLSRSKLLCICISLKLRSALNMTLPSDFNLLKRFLKPCALTIF